MSSCAHILMTLCAETFTCWECGEQFICEEPYGHGEEDSPHHSWEDAEGLHQIIHESKKKKEPTRR